MRVANNTKTMNEPKNHGHKWEILQIALTDRCNMICRHCTRDGSEKLFGTLAFDTFKKYLSYFSPERFNTLLISDWGETLIVRNLLDYLHYAKSQNWRSIEFITSDKSFHAHKPIWDRIVAEKLAHRIMISTEATTPELYEYIRQNKYENFRSLVSGLTQLRKKYKNNSLKLIFAVCCMKINLHDLPNIIKLAADFGIDEIFMSHLNTTAFKISNEKLCVSEQHLSSLDRKEVLHVFEEVIRLAEENFIFLYLPEAFPEIRQVYTSTSAKFGELDGDNKRIEFRCGEPFKWVRVEWYGDIKPCCIGGHALSSLGSINEYLDFHTIWNGPEYKRLLDGLRPGGEPLEVCKRCHVLGLPHAIEAHSNGKKSFVQTLDCFLRYKCRILIKLGLHSWKTEGTVKTAIKVKDYFLRDVR